MSEISNTKFVRSWVRAFNSNTGVQGVAKELGISTVSASAKATNMRNKGVKLPSMPRGRYARDHDVDYLNNLISANLA